MANNSYLPVATAPGPGVEQFANEEIGGTKYPTPKLMWGAAGTATFVSTANPLPMKLDATQLGPDVAHGSTDAVAGSNPIKVGGQARDTNPTVVANGSRTNFIADKLGKQIVVNAIREMKGITYTQIVTASEQAIVPAASGVFRDLYGLVFANTGSTVASVFIRDSVGSINVRMVMLIPAGDTRGFTLDCGSAMKQATVNNDWTVAITGISAGNSVHCTALWVENT